MAPTARILCVGNRYRPGDDLGPRVCDRLARLAVPPDIEVVDGGLAGLDLLPLFEAVPRVILVDAVAGFAAPGTAVTLTAHQVAACAGDAFGHDAGLPYLIKLLPAVCDGPLPEIVLLGAEGPAGEALVAELADRALALARRP